MNYLSLPKYWPFALIMLTACNFGEEKVSFNQEIKPLINKRCITCHGGVKRNADFSLLFRTDALDTTESGHPSIIPGDAENSEVMRRLLAHDPEERMPFKEAPLSESEIDLIRRWINQGAEWQTHWAYIPPVMKEPSSGKVLGSLFSFEDRSAQKIDAYIDEKLEAHELEASPQADRRTLIRRVALDLTGIPPEPAAVEKFAADSRHNAYEILVDSLLASSAYGERWASWWLDMARYSDTKGYEKDGSRTIWRYRDWVIKSLNADKPFDQFTIEQLAGDLLPNPTIENYIATAFHRNTMNNDEGGTDDEEFRVASLIDRVNTTFQVWQSTTIGCVQCHSHPYDPFRHEDYYKIMAFFNNTRDEDTEGDYPKFREYPQNDQKKVEEIISWCKAKNPASENEVRLFMTTLEPKLHPHRCDQFVNGALMDNKWIGVRNKGRCRIPQIDLSDKNYLLFNYWTGAEGGSFQVTMDRPDGAVLAQGKLPKTDGQQIISFPINRNLLGNGGEIRNLFWKFYNAGIPADQAVCGVEWFVFQRGLPLEDAVVGRSYMSLLNSDPLTTPVMVENNDEYKRKTFVFERGNRLVQGAEVKPEVPASLNPMAAGLPADRLGFAKWLVSRENPLTSRTIVNRLWEQLFGQGIVTTIEDFGTQGELPSHPELLDYLSIRFSTDHQWSMKKILREMVLSETYKRDSRILNEKDPSNKWLSRGPRIRLTAEQLRDQALAVSGLLSKKMYGPSVMPYQPDRVWQSVYSSEQWVTSPGEDQNRRAVYTFMKRTSPYPSALMFDASSREVCVVQRVRTNTPLQALVTLNDPVFVDAASALATQADSSKNTVRQISDMYQRALFREISTEKLEALVNLYAEAFQTYRGDSDAALRISGCKTNDPKLAARNVVALAILNLDEFLMKE